MQNWSRRDVLKSAALGGVLAATGLPWGSVVEAKDARAHANKGKIRKANKGGTLGKTPQDIIQTLEEYKALGFDGIEGASPGIDVEATKLAIAKVDFPVHGVVNTVHWKQRLSDPDPAVREVCRKSFVQALHDSKAIGGTSVLMVPGKVTGPDETHDDVWKRSIVEIRKLIPVCEEVQIPILIENVWNGFCEKPELLRDYIDEIDSRWVRVYFDIGNVRKFGKPEEWIVMLDDRIVKLDVKDWGKENGFCRLGEGDVDWPAVRAALKQIEFTGWATREGKDKSLEDTAALMDELLDL